MQFLALQGMALIERLEPLCGMFHPYIAFGSFYDGQAFGYRAQIRKMVQSQTMHVNGAATRVCLAQLMQPRGRIF